MDIGDLGSNQAAEAIYNWKWYYNIPGLSLWLILVAAVISIKDNRNLKLLFIAIPFLVMNLFWFIFSRVIGLNSSSDAEIFNMMFSSIAACITFLWLFAPKLSKYDSIVAILLSLTSIVVIIFTGTFSYLGFTFSQDSIAALIFLIVLMFAMLLSYLLAARRCRKRYNHVRFLLWLACWMLILCIVSMVILYIVAFTIQGFPDNALTIFFMILLEGLVLGIFLYIINLPYMILIVKNSFFRDRFYACLNLEPAQSISEIDQNKSDNEQNPDSKRFENNTTD